MHIGKSVHIKGELTAKEEMTIDGTVDGRIVVESHQLTIGAHGRITAEVRAKSVIVHGKIVGNVTAEEKAEVRPGGVVEGDIHSPRVILIDGALFKGNIDMASHAKRGAGAPATRQRGEPTAASDRDADQATVQPALDDAAAPFGESGESAASAPDSGRATDDSKLSNRL
jgi:cytoskeletal protein CcmA (bactofilin family)